MFTTLNGSAILRLMDPRNEIAIAVSNSLKALGVERDSEELEDLLEVPRDTSHGDQAFPCFSFAKELKRAPQQIATELAAALEPLVTESTLISSVTAVGPYLNFMVSKGEIASELIPAILSGEFLKRRDEKSDTVMVEYSQPNTHKAFHVGHIRAAAMGDSVWRMFDWQGYKVIPVNYLGDEGTHVAKCLWYFLNRYDGEVPAENLGEFLGTLYSKANDLLNLSIYTRAPHPGVTAARVESIEPHPEENKWKIVTVKTIHGEKKVICGGAGFSEGDLVPYAPIGVKVAGRAVKKVEKKGVLSDGMICSEAEISLSEDKEKIATLPQTTEIGEEVAEVFRIPGELPDNQSVLEVIQGREKEVSEVLQKLESQDPEIHKLWKETWQWSMDEYYQIYDWLGCRFDHYFFESEVGEPSKALVQEYKEKGVFKEDSGTIGADLSEYNLGFCILIKSDGTATYASRDLSLAQLKFEKYGVDRSVYIVDSAQTLHFQQVFKCLELMGFKQAAKCHHQGFALVMRPDGKMGSRKGNVILFSELKRRLLEKINTEFLDKYRGEWPDEELDTAAHRIALATMRYGMLKQESNSVVIFDLDDWTSRSGNTGPYMLYAVARINSIMRDAGELNTELADFSLLSHEAEQALVTQLHSYPELLERAAENYSPHLVCTYVYDLSKAFNRMYKFCSVLNAETEELKVSRAMLIQAVGEVLKHGLSLLGIQSVDRM